MSKRLSSQNIFLLEFNQSYYFFLFLGFYTFLHYLKVWSVYLFHLQGNSNQDTNSSLRLPAINLDKSESPAPKILNWIQDNAMHSGKKVSIFQKCSDPQFRKGGNCYCKRGLSIYYFIKFHETNENLQKTAYRYNEKMDSELFELSKLLLLKKKLK